MLCKKSISVKNNQHMIEIHIQSGSTALIEPATWRDLNSVRHLEKVCFPRDAWPLWDLVGVLTFSNVVRYKASVDGQMVGFIAGDQPSNDGVAWIATVAVLPEYRRQGIGEALIEVCEAQLNSSRIRLSVRMSNAAAIHLYFRLGYQRVGKWPSYYADQEDALVMEKIKTVS